MINPNLPSVIGIRNFPWAECSPFEIIYVNMVGGNEFTQSLRIAEALFPENTFLQEIVSGELNTDNLQFGDYSRKGDHPDFLHHFFLKYGQYAYIRPVVITAGAKYLNAIEHFSLEERAMTVFSRENELPDIFQDILTSLSWGSEDQLCYYQEYLSTHIELDGEEGGHGDMTRKIMTFDDAVLEKYYSLRLELYQSLKH